MCPDITVVDDTTSGPFLSICPLELIRLWPVDVQPSPKVTVLVLTDNITDQAISSDIVNLCS